MSHRPLVDALDTLRRLLDKPLFFIVGTEKSGTTWLQILLDAHPQAACRGEGQFATALWPRLRQAVIDYNGFIRGLNEKVFGEIAPFPTLGETATRTLEICAAGLLLAEYGADDGVLAVGEKTPGHIRHLEELRQYFPQARFLVIVRDGRDIAVSGWYHLKRQYGEARADPFPDYARRIATIWRQDCERALAFAEHHPEACALVRYEDLHRQPEAELARLFQFLGLDAAPEIVAQCIEAGRFAKLAQGRQQGVEDPRSHFRKGIVGDWRNHFDYATWQAFDSEAGETLTRLGYDRTWPTKPSRAGPKITLPLRRKARPSASPSHRDSLFNRATRLHAAGDTEAAIEAYRDWLEAHPTDAPAWRQMGVLLKGQNALPEAIDAFRAALALEDDIPTRNALVLALYDAGRSDEAIAEGERALASKDAEAMRRFAASPFNALRLNLGPRRFDPHAPQRNVIAFSLWGDDPVYVHGALINARIAPHIYYGWSTRFYCDPSVPADAREELRRLGAQVVLLEDPAWQPIRPLWRFLVSDDPNVDFFLCRDADSRLNAQELLAVEDWLRSGKPFHAMRDHVYHMELILAGLWGGMARVLPNVRELIFAHPQYFNDRFGDQAFLMHVVWPLVREHILVHDSHYRFHGAIDFPMGYRLPRPAHVGGAVKAMPTWRDT